MQFQSLHSFAHFLIIQNTQKKKIEYPKPNRVKSKSEEEENVPLRASFKKFLQLLKYLNIKLKHKKIGQTCFEKNKLGQLNKEI